MNAITDFILYKTWQWILFSLYCIGAIYFAWTCEILITYMCIHLAVLRFFNFQIQKKRDVWHGIMLSIASLIRIAIYTGYPAKGETYLLALSIVLFLIGLFFITKARS